MTSRSVYASLLGLALTTACSQGVESQGPGLSFGDPGPPAAGSADTTGATTTQDSEQTTTLGEPGAGSTGEPPAECGDGVLGGQEMCDGSDFAGRTCDEFGFDNGELVCSEQCQILTEGCYSCGDGQRSLTEACDGDDFAGETCESLGFGGGILSCSADCASVDTSTCVPLASCGDGNLDDDEECDGVALGDATCQSLGFDQGSLSCNTGSCTLDTTGCSYLACGGEGDFCIFDENDPQSTCCPPGVGGNTLGLCVFAVCQ